MKTYVCKVFAVAVLIAGMVGAASVFGSREIIFPEVAAILAGFVLAPRLPWRTTLVRTFLTLTVCALLGTAISMYVPLPLGLQLALAYALAFGVLVVSGTTLAPIISAAVLPVMLGTEGWVYPAAATALAAVCCLVRAALEGAHVVPHEIATPHRRVWGGPRDALVRFAVVTAFACAAAASSAIFLVAPPLLVSYTQLTRRRNPLRKRPVRASLVVALCALVGTLSRSIFVDAMVSIAPSPALPVLGAAVAIVGVAVIFRRAKLLFPPAAALAILPFLLPSDPLTLSLYPLEVAAGQFLLALAARVTVRT